MFSFISVFPYIEIERDGKQPNNPFVCQLWKCGHWLYSLILYFFPSKPKKFNYWKECTVCNVSVHFVFCFVTLNRVHEKITQRDKRGKKPLLTHMSLLLSHMRHNEWVKETAKSKVVSLIFVCFFLSRYHNGHTHISLLINTVETCSFRFFVCEF